MGHLANICYQSGSHGRFLQFCLDKFSRLTPNIDTMPFTTTGTSHSDNSLSDFFYWYHPNENPPHFANADEPHIVITIEHEDVVFIDRWLTKRSQDFGVDINRDTVFLPNNFLQEFTWRDKLTKLYNVSDEPNGMTVSKAIIRDWYKLSFLDIKNHGLIVIDTKIRNAYIKNKIDFPISCFWNKEKFWSKLKEIDEKFKLELDLSDTKVHDVFLTKVDYLDTKDRVFEVIDAIKSEQNIDISSMDVVEQAYLSAWIEQTNSLVKVPFSQYFFQNTGEIIKWLRHYPDHYRMPNHNLPTK